MDKFERNYFFTAQLKASSQVTSVNSVNDTSGDVLEVEPPFTIEFDITRKILQSVNLAQIRIYNLNADHRSRLRFDISDYSTLRKVNLRAGYGETANLPLIFTGNFTQAWSVREGNNFISQIECYDGGFSYVNGLFNQQFTAGSSRQSIIDTMASSLPGVEKGVIGAVVEGEIARGASYSGNTVSLINELVPNGLFIDNGKVNILGKDEVLQGDLDVIDSDSGLLGTPLRENSNIRFDMLFEPRLKIGQLIRLESSGVPEFNGDYKILGLKHRGMISDAVAGDVITSVELYKGPGSLRLVTNG